MRAFTSRLFLSLTYVLVGPSLLWADPKIATDFSTPPVVADVPLEAATPPLRAAPTVTVDSPLSGVMEQRSFQQILGGDPLKPRFQLRGRIESDADFVAQTARDRAALGDILDSVGFRRAFLGAQGQIGENFRWVSEFDFASGNISFRDVYGAIDDMPFLGEVRLGHFREPFSLDGATSSNVITFMERSPLNQLDPALKWGIGIFRNFGEDQRGTLAMSVYRSGTNAVGYEASNVPDVAFGLRSTYLPLYEEEPGTLRLVLIGGAFTQSIPKDRQVVFNPGPQSSLLQTGESPDSPLLPRVTIPTSDLQLFNLQTMAIFGPLSVQAEWDAMLIHQIGGGPILLHGFYAQCSYFLTGEHRGYNRRYGSPDEVKVLSPSAATTFTRHQTQLFRKTLFRFQERWPLENRPIEEGDVGLARFTVRLPDQFVSAALSPRDGWRRAASFLPRRSRCA